MKRSIAVIIALGLTALASCDAQQQENAQTYNNRQAINSVIPVPPISFSMRRWVLVHYYELNARPRLPTCSILTSRGASQGTELAIVPTFGMAVNLSNQVTSPGEEEPDSVYAGHTDQTVVILRNGGAFVSEADVTTVFGDCPSNAKPNTLTQKVLDAEMAKAKPTIQMLPPSGS